MIRFFTILFCLPLCLVSCKSPEAQRPVKTNSGSFIQQSAERNKLLYELEQKEILKVIAEDTKNEYLASDSGFWYYYNIKDSTGTAQPKLGDAVTFTYDVKTLNGTTVLTTAENGLQEYRVDKSNQELISGIRDGIKLMKAGETITFLFPSYKAYGYYGIEDKLGTNVPISSTVTLKTIQTLEN